MTPSTLNSPWQPLPEPELVPYQALAPWRDLGVNALLVLAPHPDDEVFGCGGLLALAVQQGVRVQVVVVSDGAAGGNAVVREQECRSAAHILGYGHDEDSLQFWRLPDRGLVPDAALVDRIRLAIAASRVDWVLAPSPFEIHPDHRAVCEAATLACAGMDVRLGYYEVGQALMANRLVNISAVQALKQQAMRSFASQLEVQDYAEHIIALNRYRSYTLGPGVTHAEALFLVDGDLPASGRDAALWSLQRRWPDARGTAVPAVGTSSDAAAPAPASAPAIEQLQRRLDAAEQAYARLESGYRQVTASLSWRITAPLRLLRGAVEPEGRRAGARAMARWLLRPLSPALRQRLKAGLAARAFTAPLLRWLAPVPAVAELPLAEPAGRALDKEAVRTQAEADLTAFLAGAGRIVFPPQDRPRVSVIVVLYNQAGLSSLCLQALSAVNAPSFELILVDNASTDRMPELLARVDGARQMPQAGNLGFLRAVNLAARQARGDYLLLLNNDALVFPDTLQRAVQRLDQEPDAAAVGGPILWWDGRLQEAGSMVWRDGSCLGYGRGDSPEAGPYRFVRDVDYCSGALLMLRRALFEAMGGFDEAFAPAYYEESDLCVRYWQAGHRVVYDPAVRAKHFEFASDLGSGQAMALQARNRLKFEAKHRAFLQGRPEYGPTPQALLAARMRLPAGTLRVLVIDDRVPLPALGRGYPRAARLLQALVQAGAFVTHYPLLFPTEDWQAVGEAIPERVEVMQGLGLAGLAGFLQQRAGSYDVLLVSRPHNMEVLQAIRRQYPRVLTGVQVVYDAEALFSLRDISRAEVLAEPLPPEQQQRLVADEMRLARGAHVILTVSALEADHYRRAGHQQVHVLGHAISPTPGDAGFEQRHGFLFVGALEADNSPNTDSVLWFVREVWPLVRATLGEQARLDLVGPCESTSVPTLVEPGIRLHGRVASVRPYYDRARVFIVPTRFAAGLPHKAHEAAAHGLPMVVSPLIADQLGWHDPALPVAEGAQAFAEACLALHADPARWQACRAYGLEAVARDCAAAAFDDTVRSVLRGARAAADETPQRELSRASDP